MLKRAGSLVWVVVLASAAASAQEADPVAGKEVFDLWCKPCHAVEPRKHPGTAALQVLYKGEKPAALEQRLDLTPELVSYYVRTGVSIMPFFRKTEISDKQLVDLGAYLSPDRQ
jgi:mono/diheme cytochrome c family protein